MGLPRVNGETCRLFDEPDLRFTPSGKAVCNVPMVFNKHRKLDDGTWEQTGTMFVRGAVWGDAAENVAETLSKGDEVIVSGELSVREYERKDGSKGQSVEMNVYAIGPTLKRVSAKINRVDRGSQGKRPAPSDDPWAAAPPANGDDEPPF